MTAARPASCRQPRSRMRHGAGVCLLLLNLFACDAARAIPRDDIDPELERSVKAAFLYKFLGFVEWPEEAIQASTDPLMIGVLNADDIATELEKIVSGRSVDGKPIEVRRLRHWNDLSEALPRINLLFVGRSGTVGLPMLKTLAQRESILLVCEDVVGPEQGCAINFVLLEGRVRFEVSQQTAEDSGLRLSSRLLAVALQVDGRKP